MKARRFFNNLFYMHNLYLVLLLLTLVVFGLLGIGPALSVTYQKMILIKDMYRVNNAIVEKNAALDSASDFLIQNSVLIDSFNKIISTDFNSHKYLIDFFTSAGQAGYEVVDFKKSDSAGTGETSITAEVKGSGDINVFIDKIENLKKTTEVESILYSTDQKGPRITLKLKVYNWTKK